MSKANRSIDLAVDGIEGFWSELPQWFSFSSILEAEICPLRWSLKRAVYPDLWEERGYPDSFNTTMLAGTVVHESLEIIIRALNDKGCTSIQTPEAVEILRSLGGYSAVILRVADENIGRLKRTRDVAAVLSISDGNSPSEVLKYDKRYSHSSLG